MYDDNTMWQLETELHLMWVEQIQNQAQNLCPWEDQLEPV